jgi:hypothetical protein
MQFHNVLSAGLEYNDTKAVEFSNRGGKMNLSGVVI